MGGFRRASQGNAVLRFSLDGRPRSRVSDSLGDSARRFTAERRQSGDCEQSGGSLRRLILIVLSTIDQAPRQPSVNALRAALENLKVSL